MSQESRKRKLMASAASSPGTEPGLGQPQENSSIAAAMQQPPKKKLAYMAAAQGQQTKEAVQGMEAEEEEEEIDYKDVLTFKKRAIWCQMKEYKRKWLHSEKNLSHLESKHEMTQKQMEAMVECWDKMYEDLQVAIWPILKENNTSNVQGKWLGYMASRSDTTAAHVNKAAIGLMSDFAQFCHGEIQNARMENTEKIERMLANTPALPDVKEAIKLELQKFTNIWVASDRLAEKYAKLMDEFKPISLERERLSRKVTDLTNKLESVETSLWKTRKAFDRQRFEPNTSLPSDTSQTPIATTSVASLSCTHDNVDVELLKKELESAQEMGARRLKEIQKYRDDFVVLKQDYESIKHGRMSDRFIMESPLYRSQQNHLHTIKLEMQDMRGHVDRLMREVDDVHRSKDDVLHQVHKEQDQRYNDDKANQQKLEETIRALEREKFDLTSALEQSKAQFESTKQTALESNKLIDAMKGHNKVLKDEASRLKTLSTLVQGLRSDGNTDEAVARLEKVVSTQQEDEAALIAEIETIGEAFNDLQEQNSRLLRQLREKEDVNVRLLQDKIKSDQDHAHFRLERENHRRAMASLKQDEVARNDATHKLRSEKTLLRQQMGNVERELSAKRSSAETQRRKVNELTQILNDMQRKLDHTTSQCRGLDERLKAEVKQTETLKFEKNRLEEENSSQRKKLTMFKKKMDGVSVDNELEEELANYKTLLRCNTCELRPKDTVLLRCMHCFCRDCIDTRIETRQRKCPTCGEPFGVNDVQTIFL